MALLWRLQLFIPMQYHKQKKTFFSEDLFKLYYNYGLYFNPNVNPTPLIPT